MILVGVGSILMVLVLGQILCAGVDEVLLSRIQVVLVFVVLVAGLELVDQQRLQRFVTDA